MMDDKPQAKKTAANGEYRSVQDSGDYSDATTSDSVRVSSQSFLKSDALTSSQFGKKDLSQIDVDIEQENDGSSTSLYTLDKEATGNQMIESVRPLTKDGNQESQKTHKKEIIIKLTDARGWSEEVIKYVEHPLKKFLCCSSESIVDHFLKDGEVKVLL